jgi:hypothetical protein
MDPDPGGPKTYGSYGSGFGSGSATLVLITLAGEQLVDVAKALAYLGPVGRVQVLVGCGQGTLILSPWVTVTRLSYNRQIRNKRM